MHFPADRAGAPCVPPSPLGPHPPLSLSAVQVNAPSAVPEANGAVRGNINSLLFLEPIDATTTRARYVVEVEPKGWLPGVVRHHPTLRPLASHGKPPHLGEVLSGAWGCVQAVEAAADDLPGTLGVIKAHLEGLVAGLCH